MNIVLFANGSSENHGCEAIKKSTMLILGDNKYIIGTTNIHYEDKNDGVEYVNYSFKKRYSILQRVLCRLKLLKNPKGKLKLNQFASHFENSNLSISVGGDNYCYGNSDWLYYLHDLALSKGNPTILWGASIEESLIDERMLNDFEKFDKIFVRESISYETLKNKGLNNVVFLPDPAFILPTNKPNLFDDGFSDNKKYIGLNISPLVERKEFIPVILQNNIKFLIDYILQNTNYDVLLIPHVVTKDNNDFELLSKIKSQYPTERVVLIHDHSCEVLKYYISRCEMLIASRTHASIAAYSNCVPTVVIGYSVKSKGIAKDLFGDDKNFVIPICDINTDDSLLNSFNWLLENKEEIRNKLIKTIPKYIDPLLNVEDLLKL